MLDTSSLSLLVCLSENWSLGGTLEVRVTVFIELDSLSSRMRASSERVVISMQAGTAIDDGIRGTRGKCIDMF